MASTRCHVARLLTSLLSAALLLASLVGCTSGSGANVPPGTVFVDDVVYLSLDENPMLKGFQVELLFADGVTFVGMTPVGVFVDESCEANVDEGLIACVGFFDFTPPARVLAIQVSRDVTVDRALAVGMVSCGGADVDLELVDLACTIQL